eukprot:6171885-Pleurochrysis_carterae.AAC.2
MATGLSHAQRRTVIRVSPVALTSSLIACSRLTTRTSFTVRIKSSDSTPARAAGVFWFTECTYACSPSKPALVSCKQGRLSHFDEHSDSLLTNLSLSSASHTTALRAAVSS